MAKDSRFKYQYRKNASKLHKAVGEVLRTSLYFKNYSSFQEYPVNKVLNGYESGAHKFDWVIPGLKLVIECHGRQHYELVNFGGELDPNALKDIQRRDRAKKNAALSAGYRYIEISYKELKEVTADLIIGKIKTADWELQEHEEESDRSARLEEAYNLERKARSRAIRKEYLESDAHKEQLERARKARRERYLAFKEKQNGS